MWRLTATIRKCLDFLPEMSGVLDTRIPTYCNCAINPFLSRFLFSLRLSLLFCIVKWRSIVVIFKALAHQRVLLAEKKIVSQNVRIVWVRLHVPNSQELCTVHDQFHHLIQTFCHHLTAWGTVTYEWTYWVCPARIYEWLREMFDFNSTYMV